MKKILAALLVASFGAGLMAQELVYDYKASIKRLDAQFSIKGKKPNQFVASSYKVASDTISGYIALPICKSCYSTSALISTSGLNSDDFTGFAYLVRKGDKLSKKAKQMNDTNVPYVLVTPVKANAALFGAYVNVKDENGEPQASIQAANKSWMWLDYALPDDAVKIHTTYVLKNVAEDADGMTLGFLGLTNNGVNEDRPFVMHTGFGTAKKLGWSQAADLGWCKDGEAASGSCMIVNTISGTLVGYPNYFGMCKVTPIWNVCWYNTKRLVLDGVVSGSWTLKYNEKVTAKYNTALSSGGWAAAHAFIVQDKLKAKYAADVIVENYAGPTLPEAKVFKKLGLIDEEEETSSDQQ